MLNAIMCTFLEKTRTEPVENILTNRQTEKASKTRRANKQSLPPAKEPERDGGGGREEEC